MYCYLAVYHEQLSAYPWLSQGVPFLGSCCSSGNSCSSDNPAYLFPKAGIILGFYAMPWYWHLFLVTVYELLIVLSYHFMLLIL